jgi:hypothetical protein
MKNDVPICDYHLGDSQ